jgi:hypothetical protein
MFPEIDPPTRFGRARHGTFLLKGPIGPERALLHNKIKSKHIHININNKLDHSSSKYLKLTQTKYRSTASTSRTTNHKLTKQELNKLIIWRRGLAAEAENKPSVVFYFFKENIQIMIYLVNG